MGIKTIKEFKFYFKPDTVIMQYRDRQFTCFHVYDNPRKKPLKTFASDIVRSRDMSLDRVYALARTNGVSAMGATSASIGNVIIRARGDAQPREHSNSRILW